MGHWLGLSFARLRPSERRNLAEALDTPELRGQVFDRFGAFLRGLPLETADGQEWIFPRSFSDHRVRSR
jgi:hypothetical protein